MATAPFTVYIPEEDYPKLLEWLDKEFPHCAECGARFAHRLIRHAGKHAVTEVPATLCTDCVDK